MTLDRAYYLLAAFYSLMVIIGVIAILAGGGTLLAPIHLLLGALAVIGLWGYILKRGFMNPRMWRPLAGVLAVGVVVQLVIMLTSSLSSVLLTWMLTSSIFSVMLVIMLYRYGDRDQPLWASDEERTAAQQLDLLLSEHSPITAIKRDGSRENSVKVSKSNEGYKASVTRRSQEGQESFEERFHYPETLVFFLEKFTSVTVNDFRRSSSLDERGGATVEI
ncbi:MULTISPECIES: hypothetical protein [unclassified Halomonas]|uniref:hypothetical protein n=1 Tax=unclassified Halomonas TaxID=2609666 RepID=UPI001CF52590|nr:MULTISPECIES: hypothetical protein [unclassified Halomonas]MCA8863350.1 hypothetical protein [Halomonas sp. SBBP1]UZH08670.1 hypothetical protein OM794_15025 [Halomonas sp. BDJS001]